MDNDTHPSHNFLADGATVAVIGGGPAGAFFALHFLQRAKDLGRRVKVVIFERRLNGAGCGDCHTAPGGDSWKGCGYCAGGISPRLYDELERLDLRLPAEVIQGRIHSITIQGYWKNIELAVPKDRKLYSVFRGVRPLRRTDRQHHFDAQVLEWAVQEGAELIGGDVCDAEYDADHKPVLHYHEGGATQQLVADFVVFAGGVNACEAGWRAEPPLLTVLRRLNPDYVPPRLRKSLIFELETTPGQPTELDGELHFVEYGSKELRLEMCSLLPKRGYVTVVLVGPAIDESTGPAENGKIIRQFLELPHIGKLMPARLSGRVACICNPRLAVGSARHPLVDRVAVVGDLVVSRLYKDGIRTALQTSQALAEAVLTWGVDARSLREAYGPVIRQLHRDNQFAALVFYLHRIIFGSSVLSRILYQAVITERKNQPASRRHLEKLLWKIASGDEDYETIFWRMIGPATMWPILTGGALITLRNYTAELMFGLSWEGIGRFTTGVAKEQFETKRAAFARALADHRVTAPARREFERMYTIRIRSSPARVLEQLGHFGEADRSYLRPRWVKIQRIAGTPNEAGCVIRYEILRGLFSFSLELQQVAQGRLVIYRVRDGFARGGVLLFEIEPAAKQSCNLSIYVAFDFERGRNWRARFFWGAFRRLFPAFVHDVIWNQSLCQLKNIAESSAPAPALAAAGQCELALAKM